MRKRVLTGVPVLVASLMFAGCTPTAPPTGSTSASASPVGQVIAISPTKGSEIDRPTFPVPQVLPAGFVDAPEGDGLTGYLRQKVPWEACEEFECADIKVPLDYANPGGQAITLSLAKRPATASPRIGTLFINPGGPGGSGKELLAGFNTTGLERYDIVGWDPRGTGDSTPVHCFGDSQTDALNLLDSSPDDPAELNALIVGSYGFGQACWAHSGTLLEHISTIDTARDLDLLRRLVGDAKLHYLGYSYGTQIGAYYAELFPQNTGRLVLDAAVDITDDQNVIQAMGFDVALGNFATWCGRQHCVLGSSKDDVIATIRSFLDHLDATPLVAGQRVLTQSLAAAGVAAYLYGGVAAWPALARDVRAAIQGRGQALLRASDSLNDRDSSGHYGSMYYAFWAITCLDATDDGVTDAEAQWARDEKKAPFFGTYFGPSTTCPLWPVRSTVQLDVRGRGAAPLVVVGATGDPATPYQQAVTMADRLQSAVLVTYQGEGHGTFGSGKSSCVDGLVLRYLVQGTVPADGTRCR